MLLLSLILLVSGSAVVHGMGNCTVQGGCAVSVVKVWESSQRLLRDITADNQVLSWALSGQCSDPVRPVL